MEQKEFLIKKYNNRRLYDTEKSAYVTLDEIAGAIRQGRTVKVIDAKTQEDVTSAILSQIILEEARKKKYLLPAPLLHLVIQYGEGVLTDFFDKYLEQMIKNYLVFRHLADDQYKKWLEYGEHYTQMNPQAMAGLSPFKTILDIFAAPSPKKRDKDKS